MGHATGLIAVEIDRDTHHQAKIAAITAKEQLRDWVAEAIRMRLAAEGAQATKAPKAPKAKASKAEDQKAKAAREVAESVLTVGKPVRSIAEPRDFAVDPNADLDAMPNPFL